MWRSRYDSHRNAKHKKEQRLTSLGLNKLKTSLTRTRQTVFGGTALGGGWKARLCTTPCVPPNHLPCGQHMCHLSPLTFLPPSPPADPVRTPCPPARRRAAEGGGGPARLPVACRRRRWACTCHCNNPWLPRPLPRQPVPRRPPSSPHSIQSDRREGRADLPRARGLRAAAAGVLGSDRH